MSVCVCARVAHACVFTHVRLYIADGWAGIACTVTANTCVVTVADN